PSRGGTARLHRRDAGATGLQVPLTSAALLNPRPAGDYRNRGSDAPPTVHENAHESRAERPHSLRREPRSRAGAAVRDAPPAPPRRADGRSSPTFGCLFAASLILNVGAALVLILVCCVGVFNWQLGSPSTEAPLVEKVISGNASAKDKVAVIQLDGVIMEGF